MFGLLFFFFQAEDGIRDLVLSRGLGDVYKRQGQGLLLIEDAIYAATKGSTAEAAIRAACGNMKVYALQPDMDARGVTAKAIEGVTLVDYSGFVDLVAQYSTSNSWL